MSPRAWPLACLLLIAGSALVWLLAANDAVPPDWLIWRFDGWRQQPWTLWTGPLLHLVLPHAIANALALAALAVLAAALRDTVQIVGFALSIGIFLSPVLFPPHLFPADWRWVLWLNPMTAWISGYQAVLLQGAWPAWPVWLAAGVWLAVGALLLNVLLRRSRDQLIDWL